MKISKSKRKKFTHEKEKEKYDLHKREKKENQQRNVSRGPERSFMLKIEEEKRAILVVVSSSLHTMTEGEERRPWTDMRM